MMNLQLRKELVGLRWAWGIALLVALVPVLGRPEGGGAGILGLWIWLFFLGCVVLGMEVMGQEFSARSLGLILTQPLARSGLWRWKMAALGLALALVSVLFLALSFRGIEEVRSAGSWLAEQMPSLGGWLAACGTAVLAGAGVALWLSLVVRQSVAVFWLALLLPTSLYGLVGMIAERVAGGAAWHTPGLAVLAGLGGVAWWGAYRLFLRAEDTTALARELEVGWIRRRSRGVTSPGWALWWKELRLQQLPAVVALLAVAIWLLLVMLHRLAPSEMSGLMLVLVHCLWFLVPLFVGAVAVAEERRLGTMAAWRMLPMSRARQWWTKVAATMTAALVLGALLPCFLNLAGGWVLRMGARDVPFVTWWVWGMSWLIGGTLGLYASSVTRNLVQALSVAVMVAAGLAGTLLLVSWWHMGDVRLWRLGFALTGLCLGPVLWWLAGGNASSVVVDRRLIRRNLVLVSGTVLAIGLLSAGIFNRVWELALPEKRPGTPLPVVAGVQPLVQAAWGPYDVAVLTPDGRLWLARSEPSPESSKEVLTQVRWLGEGRIHGSMGLAQDYLCAVDTTGTLWVWDLRSVFGDASYSGDLPAFTQPPRQIGQAGEWKSVSLNFSHGVALKRDGSLWGFGRSPRGQLGFYDSASLAAQRRIEPDAAVQLGAGTVWQLAAATGNSTLAVDRDGQVWRWGPSPGEVLPTKEKDWQKPHLLAGSNDWVRLHTRIPLWGAGERADGSIWAFVMKAAAQDDERTVHPPVRLEKPIVAFIGSPRFDIAGCADGTLWGWRPSTFEHGFTEHFLEAYNVMPAQRLSRRTDWVAFSPQGWALTADGVLWRWPEDVHPLLGPPWRMRPMLTLPVNSVE